MNKITRREFIKKSFYITIGSIGALTLGSFVKFKKNILFNNNIKAKFIPSYIKLKNKGELKKRGEILWGMMKECNICPRKCKAKRLEGQNGFCHASSNLEISSAHPHFGEEKPLVGRGGSGTIFMTNCSLRCVFCINSEISHLGKGNKQSIDDMAKMMLHLQKSGCNNINFVTPTHYIPHIVLAVDKAVENGLNLPLVYNTCGWENFEVLKLLDGIIDIYLPDFKYSDNKMAAKYSADAFDYPEITKKSFIEMNRQVGVAKPAANGLIKKGLMVRHLVMPNNVSGSKEVMSWISNNLPKDTYINIMSQYQPFYKAVDYPEISRRITSKEYLDVVNHAKKVGLTNLEIQGSNYLI